MREYDATHWIERKLDRT